MTVNFLISISPSAIISLPIIIYDIKFLCLVMFRFFGQKNVLVKTFEGNGSTVYRGFNIICTLNWSSLFKKKILNSVAYFFIGLNYFIVTVQFIYFDFLRSLVVRQLECFIVTIIYNQSQKF